MSAASTIAAIATPPGIGGVGIIRVSGGRAAGVLAEVVPDWPTDYPSHKLRLSRIPGVDEALAVLMRGPNSFTGEDVVEFQCHGGPIVLRTVLDRCLAAGCRIAEPGEFTQRAYLNGRLDLTQAEAVADLINATSEAAHRLAFEHLDGSLGEEIREHLASVMEAMVLVEAALDFSHEEHVYQIERDEVLARVDRTLSGLRVLRDRFDQGRRKREGVRVVVLGPTNAGKSSLFNALHGTDRAIVTDIAGTTRDWLEEELIIDGVLVRVVDTAGLRQTTDTVEAIGIERSRNLAGAADLIVWMVDRSEPLSAEVKDELFALTGRQVLVCLNKSDLPLGIDSSDLAALDEQFATFQTKLGAQPKFDELLKELGERVRQLTDSEGVLLSRARHLEAVVAGIDALDRARAAVMGQMEHELVALDLRDALDALGSMVGKVSTDDILNRIFGEFCVGK